MSTPVHIYDKILCNYALVKVMPHLPPTGDKWGLDLKLLSYLGDLDRSPDACINWVKGQLKIT